MSSNGFLQILELKIARLQRSPRLGQRSDRRVIRAVAQSNGFWILFTADGVRHDCRLVDGWMMPGVDLVGLHWKADDSRCLDAVTSLRAQTPESHRRLLVRLRWPLFDPGTCA